MGASPLTAEQVLYLYGPQALQEGAIDFSKIANYATNAGFDYKDPTYIKYVTNGGVTPVYNNEGVVTGYNLRGTANLSNTSTINSNVTTINRGTLNAPASTSVTQGGKIAFSRLAGVGTKVATGAALVGTAAMAVSAGITLGKTVDSLLYNVNPDFWDANGMSALNPETWRSITANDDSFGANLLNVLFGFDDQGNAQMYMDENAFAYMAAYMNSQGAFNNSYEAYNPLISGVNANQPFSVAVTGQYAQHTNSTYSSYVGKDANGNLVPAYFVVNRNTANQYSLTAVAPNAISIAGFWSDNPSHLEIISYYTETYNGITYAYCNLTSWGRNYSPTQSIPILQLTNGERYLNVDGRRIIATGTQAVGSVEGIGNQPNATQPDTSNWVTYNDVLPSLQQQYPDLWNNAINYPVVQPDGTTKSFTYVPVAMPKFSTRTDTQPTSSNSTQASPDVNINTSPEELIKILTEILQETETKTNPDSTNPPENPIDTGEGSTPPLIVPVGSASSLWKIYHPTQSQIDSFGGWLWSSDFIDQILKIFNNPMEAIIGLHKVYATPIDAGNSTIKVGYLDSQVPSAYIEQQYINVSCGSVNLSEQFGNVFDYSPFTDIQLYLPFVGIVPLNVADVMRSTISIEYGIDVITGACLAMVKISRDTNTAVMYQYSGNCAVQYPISSGSYMGIVSSIISVAGGIAATVASGGAAAPLALGAAGGLLNAHTNVQHSGGFSGNAGAMGGKIPYLIITRPQTKVAFNAESMQGFPTNNYVTIGECSGYIKADSVHVINVNATDEELTEINNIIISGIII